MGKKVTGRNVTLGEMLQREKCYREKRYRENCYRENCLGEKRYTSGLEELLLEMALKRNFWVFFLKFSVTIKSSILTYLNFQHLFFDYPVVFSIVMIVSKDPSTIFSKFDIAAKTGKQLRAEFSNGCGNYFQFSTIGLL